jgi:hypothetical protein
MISTYLNLRELATENCYPDRMHGGLEELAKQLEPGEPCMQFIISAIDRWSEAAIRTANTEPCSPCSISAAHHEAWEIA